MSDPPTFWSKLNQLIRDAGWDNPDAFVKAHGIERRYDSFIPASRFLREGDFATMDELSNLAKGGGRENQIRQLKKLMRFVFALNNPHTEGWAKSDYRKFIQSIFVGQSHLRPDVSIISFNYDPYFEYRLAKVLRSRTTIRPISDPDLRRMELAATSGLNNPSDLNWLDTAGFCHLKLHGSAALPLPIGLASVTWPPKDGDPLE